MQLKHLSLLAAASGAAVAQRPTDQSICDYYTTALLKENTSKNQATLLTLVVNTAGTYLSLVRPWCLSATAFLLHPWLTLDPFNCMSIQV